VRPLDIVRKVVLSGAALRQRMGEGGAIGSADAALRILEVTTQVARSARSGPLPPARGLERVVLSAARAQLAMMASLLGLASSGDEDPAHAARRLEEGFVSPSDRALEHEEDRARVRAALGTLVAETLALADAVLAVTPEIQPAAPPAWLSAPRDTKDHG
jgi:hypothetical protein